MKRLKESNMPPIMSPIIKRSGSQEDLNVKHMNLGKSYVSALSSSLKDLKIKNLTLSGIKKNEQGLTDMFRNMPNGIQTLDVSSSSIGKESLTFLYDWMKKGYWNNTLKLEVLDLSNNKIGDEIAEYFIANLKLIDTDIHTLNLSKNNISNKAAVKLSELIEINITLQVLNLSWNQITEKGAVQLFKSIGQRNILRDLNISYNHIGRDGSMLAIEAVADLINEGSLKHLDLSYTNLNDAH